MSALSFNQPAFIASLFTFMEANGLSVREFCELVPVSSATIYKAKHGENQLAMRTVHKIEAAIEKFLEL